MPYPNIIQDKVQGEFNNETIEGPEQLKYYKRLHQAAQRQQQIQELYNTNVLKEKQDMEEEDKVR